MEEPVLVDEVACGMGKSQPDLTRVEPRGGSELLLEFETGERRLFDAAPFIDCGGSYGRLAEERYFAHGLKARKCTPRPCTSSARLSGSGACRTRFSPAAPGARRTRTARSAPSGDPPVFLARRFPWLRGLVSLQACLIT